MSHDQENHNADAEATVINTSSTLGKFLIISAIFFFICVGLYCLAQFALICIALFLYFLSLIGL